MRKRGQLEGGKGEVGGGRKGEVCGAGRRAGVAVRGRKKKVAGARGRQLEEGS